MFAFQTCIASNERFRDVRPIALFNNFPFGFFSSDLLQNAYLMGIIHNNWALLFFRSCFEPKRNSQVF